MHTHAQLSVNM